LSVHKKSPNPSNTLPQLGELELTLLKALWESPDQSAHCSQQRTGYCSPCCNP
jgi:hypothetical protein